MGDILRWMLITATATILTTGLAANAQTAAELIAKNLVARGGADRLAAIHSYVTKGELRFPGDFKLAYTETRLRTNPSNETCAVRVDASI